MSFLDLDERLIATFVECDKVMPHMHLPLQSASDRILTAMNRSYTLAEYDAKLARLRAAVPGMSVSTDVIVGFPGETEEDYEQTVAYMTRARYDSAFLFKYSARPDTKAFTWPETVSEDEKGRRLSRLIDLQHQISGEIHDGWVGREAEVLIEGISHRDERQLHGKTREFKTVVLANDGAPAGTLRRVRITGSTPVTLFAEALDTPRAEPLVSIAG